MDTYNKIKEEMKLRLISKAVNENKECAILPQYKTSLNNSKYREYLPVIKEMSNTKITIPYTFLQELLDELCKDNITEYDYYSNCYRLTKKGILEYLKRMIVSFSDGEYIEIYHGFLDMLKDRNIDLSEEQIDNKMYEIFNEEHSRYFKQIKKTKPMQLTRCFCTDDYE